MRHLISLFLLGVISGVASAQSCQDFDLERYMDTSAGLPDNPTTGTFILIDGSDLISRPSKQWLLTNIFQNRALTHFEQEGALFISALMVSHSSAGLPMTKVHAPKPRSFWDWLFESPRKTRKKHADYSCAVEAVGQRILEEPTGANESLIIETIKEIFANPRYEQTKITGKRNFVLASDLYQNSAGLSFFNLCDKRTDGSWQCPSYDDLKERDGRAAEYLALAIPRMRATDEVHIFNINVDGKVNRAAQDFWVGYFRAAGAGQVYFDSELAQMRR